MTTTHPQVTERERELRLQIIDVLRGSPLEWEEGVDALLATYRDTVRKEVIGECAKLASEWMHGDINFYNQEHRGTVLRECAEKLMALLQPPASPGSATEAEDGSEPR